MMYPLLRVSILLHVIQLCLSAPELFDNLDLIASNIFSQPDAQNDFLQSDASLDENSGYNLETLDGLNLGESYSDSSMFQSFDEPIQGQEDTGSDQGIFAGGETDCSFNDLLPASRVKVRRAICNIQQDPGVQIPKLPTLDDLPQKKLPSPSPVHPSSGNSWAEWENPEVCPMSFRGRYYIPICGTRLGEQGRYTPTTLNNLRGWTVTDATVCESRISRFEGGY